MKLLGHLVPSPHSASPDPGSGKSIDHRRSWRGSSRVITAHQFRRCGPPPSAMPPAAPKTIYGVWVVFGITKRFSRLAASHWLRRGSNPHGGYPPQDFKSCASASSATQPGSLPVWEMIDDRVGQGEKAARGEPMREPLAEKGTVPGGSRLTRRWSIARAGRRRPAPAAFAQGARSAWPGVLA